MGRTEISSCCSERASCLPTGSAPLAAALAGMALLAQPLPAHALSLQEAATGVQDLVANAGPLGPVVFVLAYVTATVLLVPASLLTVAAGALFGPALGTAVVSLASTTGAACAFLVGRYLARPTVQARISRNPRFAAVDGAVAHQGARIVLLLRLSPLFPFNLLNYGLSLTAIEFWPYVGASWVGMLPGTVAYVALGGAAKAAAETASGGGLSPLQLGLYVVGVGATLWVTKIISSAASKALAEASEEAGSGGGGDGASRPLND